MIEGACEPGAEQLSSCRPSELIEFASEELQVLGVESLPGNGLGGATVERKPLVERKPVKVASGIVVYWPVDSENAPPQLKAHNGAKKAAKQTEKRGSLEADSELTTYIVHPRLEARWAKRAKAEQRALLAEKKASAEPVWTGARLGSEQHCKFDF